MLQARGQVVSFTVIGALALAAIALAGQAPSPTPESLQTPPAISSPAQTPVSPDPAVAPAEQPQPVFLSTITECRNGCYNDFQACKQQNPYSNCLQIYNWCVCGCNDSCYP
jgi:hypothetical protein